MTMKKLLESFDRINTEGVDPTNTDGYFSGYSATHNSLYGKPQPKNPHQPGTPAHRNWEFDRQQGERDRRQEMGESDMDEAVNHLGDKEYTSFNSWKSACKKAGAEWIDGDRDIANAMKGPRPYVRGVTHQIGEWDGEVGSVYSQVTETSDEDWDENPYDPDDPAPMIGETEELDEISGKTLGSYIQKARADASSKFAHGRELDADPKVVADREKIKGWYDSRQYTKRGDSVHRSKIDKAHANIEARKKKLDPDYPKSVNGHKRLRGVEKAVSKLQHGKLTDSANPMGEAAETESGPSNAALLAKLSKVIQSCTTVDQLLSAEKFAKRVERELGDRIRNKQGFSGYGRVTDIMADITSDIRSKAEELGVVFEGAKVDRMVKHIKSSEKKLGHSDKGAESIAWATANKRGMLDNKNKVTESKVGSGVTVILNEGVKFRVSNPALAKILRRFPHEAENFNQGGDLADDLYDELYDYYANNGEMPYGTMKARTGDPYEWVSQRLAREMNAAQTDMFEGEEGSELDVILRRFPHEVKNFKEGGELDDDLYNALFDYYSDNAEIPYGIAKARTGDPFQWVSDRFCQDLGCDESRINDQIEESPYPAFVGDGEAVDESLLMELSVEDQMRITDELQELGLDEGLDFFFEGGHLVVIGRSTARLAINKVGGHIQSVDGEEVRIGPAPKERPVPAKQDINQLATVDDNIEEAVDDFEQRKVSKVFARVDELQRAIDGIERERAEWMRRGYDTAELDMDIAAYKSEIEELLSGIEPRDGLGESAAVTIQSDCDEELINVIRKLSGMQPSEQQASAATIAVVEPEVEVEEDVEQPEEDTYSNEPNPSIHTSTEKMMTSGDDLNRVKSQYPQAANPAANPMAESRALIKSYEDLLKGLKK